ncbi:MAG: universal stress protein [Planctomycetes bacterium]|nr:universal stress protein [Planctomycetota bacterium]MBL7008392.1 universal stress protein [Planctomycetota bacterium]
MFKRILLSTDFSEDAKVAYRWAAELAKQAGGTVVLVHAFEDDMVAAAPALSGYLPAEALDMGKYREEFRRGAEAAVEIARKELEALGAPVEPHLVEGRKPWQAIVQAAEDLDCGVIVMSTHGRGGLAHFLIGSTAEKVVRAAHCPVLTVHSTDAPPEA